MSSGKENIMVNYSEYIFRFALGEVFTEAAVLYCFFSLASDYCEGRKRKAVLIYTLIEAFYVFMLAVTGWDLMGNAIILRTIMIITDTIFMPWYLVRGWQWYRYITLFFITQMNSSSLGMCLFYPILNLIVGENEFYMGTLVVQMYKEEGELLVLPLYFLVNFVAYFAVTKITKRIMRSEKRKRRLMNICQILFCAYFLSMSFAFADYGAGSVIVANATIIFNCTITVIFIVRGIILENTYIRREKIFMERQERYQYKRYTRLKERQNEARKIRHDLADHLQTVQLLLQRGEPERAREYVAALEYGAERQNGGTG